MLDDGREFVRPPLLVVVDDTPGVRSVISRALTGVGHDVLTAPDLPSAAALIDGLPQSPALAIVDLQMPHTRLEELIAWSRRCPEVPVIFVSSLPEDPDLILPGLLLEKPFLMSTLCHIVGNVLELNDAGRK